MFGRLVILVLCGFLISAPVFAGVTIKQLDEYWANQRAYHQKQVDPNPEQTWWATTSPSPDDAWTPPKVPVGSSLGGTMPPTSPTGAGSVDYMQSSSHSNLNGTDSSQSESGSGDTQYSQ